MTNYMIFAVYIVIINVIAYITVWRDKRKAVKGVWRISEKTLFILAAVGGFVGIWMGMQTFRHKTQKWYFKYGIPAIAFIWLIIGIWVLYRLQINSY